MGRKCRGGGTIRRCKLGTLSAKCPSHSSGTASRRRCGGTCTVHPRRRCLRCRRTAPCILGHIAPARTVSAHRDRRSCPGRCCYEGTCHLSIAGTDHQSRRRHGRTGSSCCRGYFPPSGTCIRMKPALQSVQQGCCEPLESGTRGTRTALSIAGRTRMSQTTT